MIFHRKIGIIREDKREKMMTGAKIAETEVCYEKVDGYIGDFIDGGLSAGDFKRRKSYGRNCGDRGSSCSGDTFANTGGRWDGHTDRASNKSGIGSFSRAYGESG